MVPELSAEDVTRGYRFDVSELSAPDTWYTLHARTGSYALRTATPGEREPLPVPTPIGPDEATSRRRRRRRTPPSPR